MTTKARQLTEAMYAGLSTGDVARVEDAKAVQGGGGPLYALASAVAWIGAKLLGCQVVHTDGLVSFIGANFMALVVGLGLLAVAWRFMP